LYVTPECDLIVALPLAACLVTEHTVCCWAQVVDDLVPEAHVAGAHNALASWGVMVGFTGACTTVWHVIPLPHLCDACRNAVMMVLDVALG